MEKVYVYEYNGVATENDYGRWRRDAHVKDGFASCRVMVGPEAGDDVMFKDCMMSDPAHGKCIAVWNPGDRIPVVVVAASGIVMVLKPSEIVRLVSGSSSTLTTPAR
jgi:hypothetical protein